MTDLAEADRVDIHILVDNAVDGLSSTPLNVEGEATALFVAQVLAAEGVAVSRIASGMPHGGELEFTDQVTLGRALSGRRTLG